MNKPAAVLESVDTSPKGGDRSMGRDHIRGGRGGEGGGDRRGKMEGRGKGQEQGKGRRDHWDRMEGKVARHALSVCMYSTHYQTHTWLR